jgi:hypothetical protein
MLPSSYLLVLINSPYLNVPSLLQVVEAPKGELTELSRLEIRTGKILEISLHPEADGLYVEKIDLGYVGGSQGDWGAGASGDGKLPLAGVF